MSSGLLTAPVQGGAYPERAEEKLSALDDWGERVSGGVSRWFRQRSRDWLAIPARVEEQAVDLPGDVAGLASAAAALAPALRRSRLADTEVARAFALVRRTAQVTIGQTHYDTQLLGGYALLRGMVAEMETGEGKTLAATLPAATAALCGIPTHVVTVNDYLASRDAEAMGPIYRALGLRVGVVRSGLDPAARRAAYGCDITYCTNKEVAFDYLKDRIALGRGATGLRLAIERLTDRPTRLAQLIHRGLHYAIVDEADSVLIDEARTPLIISDARGDVLEEETYRSALELARDLERGRDFRVDERERRVDLQPRGSERLEGACASLGGIFSGRRRREQLVVQALCALHLYQRDHHYLVRDDKVQIIDEYTGRLMPDRAWERGLHQMIELKEAATPTGRRDTLARISYQRFFRRYLHLAGMTGTAREVAGELWATYRLAVACIPTRLPLRRSDAGCRVLPRAADRWSAVVTRVAELNRLGRPVLVGTRSVAASETLSARLQAAGLPHCVLNARQDREEAEIVARAGEPGRITVATNMAGRGTDVRLHPEVVALGGLHVLATERHDARRIDRQLFGRCGRQGDPGTFEVIASLEDELFQVYAGPLARRLAALATRLEVSASQRLLDLALALCQRSAGRLHRRVRRELLRQDRQLDSLLAFAGRPE